MGNAARMDMEAADARYLVLVTYSFDTDYVSVPCRTEGEAVKKMEELVNEEITSTEYGSGYTPCLIWTEEAREGILVYDRDFVSGDDDYHGFDHAIYKVVDIYKGAKGSPSRKLKEKEWRKSFGGRIIRMLHEMGGCGADPGSYEKGWDEAISAAIGAVEKEAGIFAEDCICWHITDIEWDTGRKDPGELGLPGEARLPISMDRDSIADSLSDAFGYCVRSFSAAPGFKTPRKECRR